MKIPLYRFRVDYLTRYSDFNPLLLFAQKYEFAPDEQAPLRVCYANAIVLVEEGRGTLWLKGQEVALQPGLLVFIAAGAQHQWISSPEEPMVHRCAYFDWKYVSRPAFQYQRNYFHGVGTPFRTEWASTLTGLKLQEALKVSNIPLWVSYFNAFTQPPEVLGSRSPLESLQYNGAFQTFLHHYLSFAANNDALYDPRIAKILERIDGAPLEESEANLYRWAKELNIGRSRFHQLFKRETGLTPHEYLQRLRIYRAAGDLCSSRLSVTEIAQKYNYSSIHYFSKAFRHMMGLSPSEYRLRHR